MNPLYTLSLRSKDRRLLVVIAISFAVVSLLVVPGYLLSGNILLMGFSTVWLVVAIRFFIRIFRGPTQIHILPNHSVRLVDWFGRERELSFNEISAIELEANLLTIATSERKYMTMSGFDGLHRLIGDVATHNGELVTKGI